MPTKRSINQHTCSSAVGGYSPGFRDGLAVAIGAPFEGTSDAIPAAAETGFELAVVPLLVVAAFTNVLVPFSFAGGSYYKETYVSTKEG